MVRPRPSSAAPRRVSTPSLAKRFSQCSSTVRGLMLRRAAISELVFAFAEPREGFGFAAGEAWTGGSVRG